MPKFVCCNFPMVRAILGIHVVRYQGGDYIAQGLALRDGGFHCFRSASKRGIHCHHR